MPIKISQYNLIPVRRDGQINSGNTVYSGGAGGGIGGSGFTLDPSKYYWNTDTSTLYVYGNVEALGEMAAFSGNVSTNWWNSMPLASSSSLGGIKLGNGLFWINGKVDVSVASGGIGDVTKVYVDGSLATRDTAISGKQPQLNGTGFVKASGTSISYDNNTYSLSSHNHSGTYEPANANIQSHISSAHQTIINGTGFVKASGTTISFDNNTYSLSSHNHSGTYEPANANIQSHISNTSNPHSVTKAQVGLGNCDNTADANKSVSYSADSDKLDGQHGSYYNPKLRSGKSLCREVTDWDNIGGASVQTISDGKNGNSVLRMTNGGYPNEGRYFPIDWNKVYKVSFWARAQAGTTGVLYFCLRQFTDNAGTACATNGGRSPYYPSNQSAHTNWVYYTKLWSSSDWQANMQYIQPEFLGCYGGSGYWEIQGFVFEDVTGFALLDSSPTFTGSVTSTNFVISSDERMKQDIKPLKSELLNIPYKEFELKKETGQKRYGVIAQELIKNYPELVREDENGMLSVAYIDLLIREIVYLKKEIKELKQDLNFYKNYNT